MKTIKYQQDAIAELTDKTVKPQPLAASAAR